MTDTWTKLGARMKARGGGEFGSGSGEWLGENALN